MNNSELSKFDSFSDVFRDNSIAKEFVKAFTPISSMTDVIQFNVLPTTFSFMDLSKTRLKVRLELFDTATDELVGTTDAVSSISNSLESLFRNVEVQMNDVDLEPYVGVNHPYKAYINSVLHSAPSYLTSIGGMKAFYPDSPGHFNTFTLKGSNQGFNNRQSLYEKTGETELSGFIDLDICNTNKYIPNGVGLNFKFFLSSPNFYLVTSNDAKTYNYKITLCTLYISYIDPHINIFNAFNDAIANKMAVYPYVKSCIKSYVISSGVRSASLDNIITTSVPDEIIICLISNDAYVGTYKTNPFFFETFNLNFISLTYEGSELNGMSMNPIFPTESDSYETTYSYVYINMFLENGIHDKGNLIGPHDYVKGYFLIKYSLPNSLKYSPTKTSGSPGITRLSLGFAKETTKSITLLVYTRTKSYYGIDSKKNIHLNIDHN